MTESDSKPAPGLYFIATPIGAARDITLRALDLLQTADVLVAEDTRSLRRLMGIHGIALGERRLWPYHDHNGSQVRPRILRALQEGRSVVYASEAGTPLVADPGFQLGRAAADSGYAVTAAPGPSAVLAALLVSGLPTDRFLFAGFSPPASAARRSWLREIADVAATVILFESPKRIGGLLNDLADTFGKERKAAVCRELTKKFEDVVKGTLESLAERFESVSVRGEVVVVIDRADKSCADDTAVREAMLEAMTCMSIKDAAAMVAETTGVSRRKAYQIALSIGQR